MDIYKINEELNSYLRDVTLFTAQLGNEEGTRQIDKQRKRDTDREIEIDRYMDGQIDGWIDRWIVRQTDGQID